MARVRLVEKKQASPKVRETYQKVEDNGARVINLYRAIANSPTNLLLNYIRLGNSIISQTELPPRLRELAVIRVASLSGSKYEWAQHAPLGLEVGLNQQQLDVISGWKNSSEFSSEERAVLQYTDEAVRDVSVTDRTFNELKKFFNDRLIVELTMVIGYYKLTATILGPLQVDIDENSLGSVGDLVGQRNKSG